jgi:hypothetical protein
MGIESSWHSFTSKEIEKAPMSDGVYGLFEKSAIIYYGRGEGPNGIRGRLEAHKAGYEGSCTKNADYFNYEICSNPAARERELLQEYKNTWSKLPRCNDLMSNV